MRDWLKNVLVTLYERDEDNNLLTEKQKLKVSGRSVRACGEPSPVPAVTQSRVPWCLQGAPLVPRWNPASTRWRAPESQPNCRLACADKAHPSEQLRTPPFTHAPVILFLVSTPSS